MKILVTQEHIDRGQPDRSTACPISLAIHDGWDNPSALEEIRTTNSFIILVAYRGTRNSSGEWVEDEDSRAFDITGNVCDFINKFDEFGAEAVEPCTLFLDFDKSLVDLEYV